ncbi:MAG: PLP-dependent aminotransferase family protein [Phycisphaerae bacterium]
MMTRTDLSFGFSQRARRSSRQPISELMALAVTRPDLISLAAGLVDYDLLPSQSTAELAHKVLADPRRSRASLQYGTTPGLRSLRSALLEHLEQLDGTGPGGLDATVNDLIVTTGSQQMLFILTDLLVDPGDIVITGWPSYFVYTGTLASAGAQVRCVDVDADGFVPESLESLLAELQAEGQIERVKIVYIVSYHQNPTGLTVAEDRRARLVEIVRRYSTCHRILLLEDAAYRELTYEGHVPRSIKSYDEGNQTVALLQTFSKPFSPGLKTGYALLPTDLVGPAVIQKGNHDFGSVNFVQEILGQAMAGGEYQRHLRTVCAGYARKRDAMLAAMEEHFGGDEHVHWTRPTGGLYVWLTLPSRIDTGADSPLCAAALEEGMIYVPGEYCFGPDSRRQRPTNCIRLSFGLAGTDQIAEGIARLARAYHGLADA